MASGFFRRVGSLNPPEARDTGLNPLASETDEEGQAWLRSWLTALLERKGHQLSVSDSEKLARTVESNATALASFRDFTNFTTRFRSFEGDIGARVGEWSPNGQYGWVFGQDSAPIVDFSASDIVGVDMTALLNMEIERTALLAYLFRQIEKTVSARAPTLLVLEEAGVFLDDLYFQRELKTWLATLRKKKVSNDPPQHTPLIGRTGRAHDGNALAYNVAPARDLRPVGGLVCRHPCGKAR